MIIWMWDEGSMAAVPIMEVYIGRVRGRVMIRPPIFGPDGSVLGRLAQKKGAVATIRKPDRD